MKGVWYYQIVLLLITFFLLITPWFWDGLYGFDWTDTTFHFQQALNIFNKYEIGSDFRSHVPGLSFWIEAQFFKFFGANFIVHRFLGLIFPLISMIALVLIFNNALVDLNLRDRILWSISLSSLTISSIWGQQIYWLNSSFAPAISFLLAAIILSVLKKRTTFFLYSGFFCLAILVAVQLLIKQSHGYLNFLIIFFVLGFVFFLKLFKTKNLILIIILFPIIAITSTYLTTKLYCTNCFWEMILFGGDSSMELKGLNLKEPLNILSTIIGIYNFKTFLIIFILTVISIVGLFLSNRFYLLRHLFFIALPLIAILLFLSNQTKFLLHYISIIFFVMQSFLVVKRVYKKNFDKESSYINSSIALYLASYPLVGSVIAEQLSWPGAHYVRPQLTLPLIIMQAISLFYLYRSKINGTIVPLSSLAISILISILIIHPKPRGFDSVEAGLLEMTEPKSFNSWKVSPKTASAIDKLIKASSECPGDDLFQISWMPIAYELTGRRNNAFYDLPYIDTITLNDARIILKKLYSDPPGMLIIQPSYKNYSGPFPADGIKYLYNNFDDLLTQYKLNSKVEDNFNKFDILCLNAK